MKTLHVYTLIDLVGIVPRGVVNQLTALMQN